MSNRYVWNIYSLAFTEELDGPQNYSMTASFLGVDEPVFVRQAADAHISWSLQDPTVGNYNLLTGGDEYTEEATISIEPNYYYQLAYNSGRTSCYKAGSNGATAHLSFRSSGSNRRSCTLAADNVYYPLPRRTKGTAAGTVSNSASSTYPQDGISGNYWYTYQGSDVIDATAVGYSNQAPMGGQPITINVTPGSGKVYGGTVRYTYQVQLDNGAWTTIATNSTATSQEYTIPPGTTVFAARVLASDDLGFTSSTYTTGSILAVTNNAPPSAPASISFTEPVADGTCTITWGSATDSDGTVSGYELERNVDGGDSWTQIYSGSALSYEDDIDPDWATVNYRVRAVDDDGDKGAYATSTAQAINDGWLYFSGPDEDMGTKSAPFDFAFAINSTPAGAQGIDVHVYLDDDDVYSGAPDAAEQVSVHVDMRPMRSGEHVIVVTAECGELLGVNKVCKFAVPEFDLPDGGRIIQLEDSGGPIFPQTIVSAVKGSGNQSVAGVLEQSYYSTYIGTGTSGQGNPCQTRLAFHPSLMIIQASGNSAAAIGYWVRTAAEDAQDQGNMVVYNGTTQTLVPVRWDEETMTISYYGNSAAEQLNASGVVYGIRIL